jgi:hypothetical protein
MRLNHLGKQLCQQPSPDNKQEIADQIANVQHDMVADIGGHRLRKKH